MTNPTGQPASSTRPSADLALLTESEFVALLQIARPRLLLIAAAVCCNPGDAEDIVQEASIIALHKLSEFSRGTNFEAWMAQVTRNVALNTARRGRRRRRLLQAFALQSPRRAEAASTGVADPRLVAALGEIDETARLCLVLRVVGDMGYDAISRTLQIPEGTAMSHVWRSRQRLRSLLHTAIDPPADLHPQDLPRVSVVSRSVTSAPTQPTVGDAETRP